MEITTFNNNGHSEQSNFFAVLDGLIRKSCVCCISCPKTAKTVATTTYGFNLQ